MIFKKKIKNQSGLNLVEAIVFIAIVSIMLLSVYQLVDFLLRINLDNKMKLTATAIMDQKMESIRNLPYQDIGTINGIVHGVISDNEIVLNNGEFNINTFIYYISDEFGKNEDNELRIDYKGVKLTIAWQGPFGPEEIITATIVAPKGLESDIGGGALEILVFDASGLPIEGAQIQIKNNSVSPTIDFFALSNRDGQLLLLGAPTAHEAYEIRVSKAGYSTSYTSSRTSENPNPTKPHASVHEGKKTEISFSIDLLSELDIRAVRVGYENWTVNRDNTKRDQISGMAAIAEDGSMYFVWQDLRGGENSFLYMQRHLSASNPAWSNDKKIGNSNSQFEPDIAVADNEMFFVVWQDKHYSKEDDIYVISIDGNGNAAWADEVRVNSDSAGAIQQNPKITASNENELIAVAWEDFRNENLDIYVQVLTFEGQKIWSADLLAAGDWHVEHSVDIAFDSENNIVLAWTEDGEENKNIYLQKYDMDANPLFSENLKISGAGDKHSPSLSPDSEGNIYLSWTEEAELGLKNIYLAKYDENFEESWRQLANVENHSSYQYDSSVLYFDSYVYVSWTDERGASRDVYVQKFNTNGIPEWSQDLRLNMNSNDSYQQNSYLVVNSFGPPLACWVDNRNGDWDVYASNFSFPDDQNSVAGVPFIITGAKKIYFDPDVYKYQENFITGSDGRVFVPDLEWDSYLIELSPGYNNYQIVATEPSNPVILEPDSIKDVRLHLK